MTDELVSIAAVASRSSRGGHLLAQTGEAVDRNGRGGDLV
jgi:hypothetical protein